MDESPDTAAQETAAYQALGNELILSYICELIRGEEGYIGWVQQAPQLLCSLARTCKAFTLPALKAIWKDLETLIPLVQTMPADCWEIIHSRTENATVDNVHTLRFTRPIIASDCQRLRFYASFVRTILNHARSGRSGVLIVEPNVFHFLAATYQKDFPNEHLLPSLDKLTWFADDDLIFPHFLLLLNPNLGTMHLGLNGGDPHVRVPFLRNIPQMCPQLQSLSLCCDDLALMAVMSKFFCDLPRLQSLRADTLSTETYIKLSEHQELTKMTLGCLDTIDWNTVADQLRGRSTFPALKHIQVDEITEMQCCRLLQNTRSSFESLKFAFSDCQTGTSFYRVLDVIKNHCPPTLQKLTLKHLMIPVNDPDRVLPSADPLLPTHLTPLFVFPKFTELCLHVPSDIHLDDNWVQRMATNLPNIRSFFVLSHNSYPEPRGAKPLLYIDSLIHFVLNCPRLEELGLAFDAGYARLPEKVSRRPSLHPSKLTTFYVGNSPIWDVYTVAAIFSDWFPKVYHIAAGPLYVEGGSDLYALQRKWTEVEDTIPMIMKIRNQERRGRSASMGSDGDGDGDASNAGSDEAMNVDG